MRLLVTVALIVLFPLAVGGLGLGGWILYQAIDAKSSQLDYAAAVGVASIPLLIGTVALGSIGIIAAIRSRDAR